MKANQGLAEMTFGRVRGICTRQERVNHYIGQKAPEKIVQNKILQKYDYESITIKLKHENNQRYSHSLTFGVIGSF